jgi:hypothetical protein
VEALKQNVILPLTGDPQIPRREPETREPVALQDALGSTVVAQRPGLDAVQAQLVERDRAHLPHCLGGVTATVVSLGDPVPEIA